MTATFTLFTAGMNSWRAALRLVGVGFFIVGLIILGLFMGLCIDHLLKTGILWLVGLLAGLGTAFFGVYRLLRPFLSNDEEER